MMFKIAEENKNKKGVYWFLNLITGDFYIGSTCCFWQRFKTHIRRSKDGHSDCPYLYNAIRKHGVEFFQFNTLEIANDNATKKDLEEMEQKYMTLLNPKYNVRKLASSNLGCKHRKDAKSRLKNVNASKVIIQFTMDNIKIREFSSITEANKFLGPKNNISQISECCVGLRRSAQGYKWAFKDKKNKKFKIRKLIKNKKHKKRIFIKKNNLITKFSSITECAKYLNVAKSTVEYYLKRRFVKKHNLEVGAIK